MDEINSKQKKTSDINENLQEVKEFYKSKVLNDFIKPKKNVFRLFFKYLSIYIISIISLIVLNIILYSLQYYSIYIWILSLIVILLLSIILFIMFIIDSI